MVPGIHATGSLTPRRVDTGFRMVTVVTDLTAMLVGAMSELEKARGSGDGDDGGRMY